MAQGDGKKQPTATPQTTTTGTGGEPTNTAADKQTPPAAGAASNQKGGDEAMTSKGKIKSSDEEAGETISDKDNKGAAGGKVE